MLSSISAIHALPEIHELPPEAINRIAAGEVIERPASIVKELVENALDACATSIEISITEGGLSKIRISDDGHGMNPDMLIKAVQRHATSKLKPDEDGVLDLLHIQSMGFRGEALPSISSISRLQITSSVANNDAHCIIFDESGNPEVKPSAFGKSHGTEITVEDIFYSTPARLKFMRSARSETNAVTQMVKQIALAQPDIGFKYEVDGKLRLLVPRKQSLNDRIAHILTKEFVDNAIPIDLDRDSAHLTGLAGLPTFNRGGPSWQYLFVNDRPVKDRMLVGCLRAAYQDLLAKDRHPAALIYLKIDPQWVDVNVHPAKTEVRFRDAASVRGLIISGLRHALAQAGHRASTTISDFALGKIQPRQGGPYRSQNSFAQHVPNRPSQTEANASYYSQSSTWDSNCYELGERQSEFGGEIAHPSARQFDAQPARGSFSEQNNEPKHTEKDMLDAPLGAARTQIFENYIIAQTENSMVIVDQHAAHERLTLAKLKDYLDKNETNSQALLIPEIVELPAEQASLLLDHQSLLERAGLTIEPFGDGAISVTHTPTLLKHFDVKGLIFDLVEDILQFGETMTLTEQVDEICSTMACRAAVKSGNRLHIAEMNGLLREMEATPFSGQCNHGRPTYVELSLADIEKLFGRR